MVKAMDRILQIAKGIAVIIGSFVLALGIFLAAAFSDSCGARPDSWWCRHVDDAPYVAATTAVLGFVYGVSICLRNPTLRS